MASKKTDRHDKIVDLLNINPSIRVNELAQHLDVSTETIRRDLRELDEMGEINRTYGGAVRSSSFEPALNVRLALNSEEKLAISKRAMDFVFDAEVILIGGGATCVHFARELRRTAVRVTVITPSLNVAFELGAVPSIEVVVPPGIYNGHEGLVLGHQTVEYLQGYRVHSCFIGASGINEDGASEAVMAPSQLYREMTLLAEQNFVLADHSKFEKRAMGIVTPWKEGITLVTDQMPDKALANSIGEAGAKLEIV